MKIVLLLAGRGRRLSAVTGDGHKALVEIRDRPALAYLGERLAACAPAAVVPVLGHAADAVLACLTPTLGAVPCEPVFNPRYAETNNLFSLWSARQQVAGGDFLVVNGDLVLDREILASLAGRHGQSAVAVDDTPRDEPVDSPGIVARNGRIVDLGRHVPAATRAGYAIGAYRFNASLASAFFPAAERLLNENLQAGFHDPLRELYADHPVALHSTGGLCWTDFDVPEDLPWAAEILDRILTRGG